MKKLTIILALITALALTGCTSEPPEERPETPDVVAEDVTDNVRMVRMSEKNTVCYVYENTGQGGISCLAIDSGYIVGGAYPR